MSSETRNTTGETAEPRMGMAPVPIWVFVLLFAIAYGCMVYFDERSGWFRPEVYAPYRSLAQLEAYQPPSGGPDLGHGRAIFESNCALCHNSDGMGKPNQAPAFVGSDWVLGSPARMIRIPLYGLSGPLPVKGETWNLSMAAMGATLKDEDLSAVLTYIRQSWGNKASPITAEQVKAVKAEVGNRAIPWTAEELSKVP